MPKVFPPALPTPAVASGSRFIDVGRVSGVRPSSLHRLMVKESATEVPDGIVWGVRSGWVGVTGRGRRPRRGFLWVNRWGVRAAAAAVVSASASGSFLTGVKAGGVGGRGSRAIASGGGATRGPLGF
jgi:hypothetical protein